MKKIGEFMKKRKKLVLLYCIIGVLLLSTAGISVFLIHRKTSNENKNAGKLYWNVDGKEHWDTEMGLSKRRPDEDGAYRVTFAVDGEQVKYEVENKKLLHQIDNKTLMGLEFNEDGVVVGVLDPKDVMADEIAPSYYVMSTEEDKIITNGMQTGEGIEVEIPLTKNTNIWNMKSTAKLIGERGTPVKDDIVRAFLNDDGEVTDVFIVGVYNPFGTEAIPGYCEHCKQTVGWYEWSDRHTLPTVTAHWRLVYDIECNKRQVQIGEDQHLVIDLNGKTVMNTVDYRLYCTFNAGGSLAIIDSSQEQTGRMVARGESNSSGMVFWVRYGNLSLYSGTLDASQVTTTANGAAVALGVDTTFDMYGGTIIGGTSKTVAREDGKGYIGGFGGAVSVARGAVFNMYGGTIKDGNAVYLKKDNGTIIGGGGGNVYLAAGATMNMESGEILDGRAQQMAGNVLLGAADAIFTMKNDAVVAGGQITEVNRNSGNIHIWAGATMNMEGGTVKDGVATAAGGNITVYGTLNMSGGQILNGKIKNGENMNALKEIVAENANIHCYNGTFSMTGGYIDGYVRFACSQNKEEIVPKSCKVSISGDAQITGGKKNVTLFGGVVIDMGKLSGKANITMTSGGYVTNETAASNVAYVHSDIQGLKADYVDSKIFIGKMHCVCGTNSDKHIGECDGTKLPWKPWSDATSLPRDNDNYFLTCDVTLEKEVSVAGDSTLRIDLNGHKIYGANNSHVFQVTNPGSKLILTNTSEKIGRIVAKGTEKESLNGMCIWLGGKENYAAMYAGILDATGVVSRKGGPALFVAVNNTFDMFGGTISGGSVKKNEQNSGGSAGTIYVNGTLNVWNGLIYGGNAEGNGGNIYVANGATLNLRGGRINGGKSGAKGGNIHSHGIVNMYENAYIEKGESTGAGGNILIGETSAGSYGTLNMYGGTIANGVAKEQGGNLALEGNFKMTEGLICDGKSGRANSENVGIWQRQETDNFEMTGGEINGGVAFMTNSDAPDKSIIKAVLSGTAVVKNPKKEAVSLLIPKNNQITIGDLKAGAEIWITGSGTVAKDAVAADIAYIKLDEGSSFAGAITGVTHCEKDNTLFVGVAEGPGTCICGRSVVTSGDNSACIGTCDGVWHSWTPTITLPTKSGYYYLVKDIEAEDTAIIGSNMNINLDLHGHSITNKNEKRLITISSGTSLKTTNTKLNLTDHVGEGSMYLTKTPNGGGGIVLLQGAGNEVSIYGGNYDASAVNCTANGVAVCITGSSASVLHVYDGAIIGGTTSGNGGAVYVANTNILDMKGGSISGGKAALGGNVYMEGSMKLSGGATISGGAKNTEGAIPNGGSSNVYVKQGTATTNEIVLKDCTVEGIGVIQTLVSPIQVTNQTIISNPKNGVGLVVAEYAGTWLTWSGPEYTVESRGKIVTSSTPLEGAVVMDKGVLLKDRELFRERVIVKDGLKLFFEEVKLDKDGNPTEKGKIVTINSGAHVHCACGGMTEVCGDGTKAHNELKYTSITSVKDLPNTAGNYHLKHDVNLAGVENITSGQYNLCLNGYQLTGSTAMVGNATKGRYGSRVFEVKGGTLNVLNCSKNTGTVKAYSKWQSVDGKESISGTMNFSGAGGVFLIDGGTVNCYAVHLDASDWYLPNGTQWKGSIAQVKSGTLTGHNCTYVAGQRTNVNLNGPITTTSRTLGVDQTPFISGTASSNFANLGLPVTAFKEKDSE